MASGADVPQELFDLITSFLILRYSQHAKNFYERNLVKVDKHEMSCCALVCRRWATICRPQLFQEITISCARDVNTFVSFLQNPKSVISGYIKTVTISPYKLSTAPWMHLLCLVLFRTLRPDRLSRLLDITIEGPLPAKLRTLRSIHGLVPRTLTPQFSRHIAALRLTDIRFQRFDDLMRLVGELPQVYQLFCKRLTWGTLPDTLPLRRAVIEEQGLTVEFAECQNNWPAIWTDCGFKRDGELNLLPDELMCIGELAQILESSGAFEVKPTCSSTCFRPRDGGKYKSIGMYFLDPQNSQRMVTPSVTFRPTDVFHAAPHTMHITTVSIDFKDRKLDLGAAFACNWAEFTKVLLELPFVAKVNLGFAKHEDISRFVEDVVATQMSELQLSGRLQFMLWDNQKVRWSYASLGSEELKREYLLI
ncbi:hypothetical protein NM688_g7885 [Phlebia brevispora]|uniref:Uncharacterized protein n=1 Tax=Phlebia brevispora TaxID=194682 RepID=A0ACC1S012_9APHY|nr:hypothetical protein NM688_g7885 [Phlebia brevispora]